MIRTYAGFLGLTLTFSYLYIGTVLTSLHASILAPLVIGIAYIVAILGVLSEARNLPKPKSPFIDSGTVILFLSLVVGALITYGLSVYAHLGAVVASGLVTLLAGILFPKLGLAITCGSFVGMTSSSLFAPNELFLAACIAGLVYLLAADVFNGFGGKLGTIAATGATLAAVFTNNAFVDAKPLEPSCLIPAIVACALSSAVSFCINNRMKQGGVIASGAVSLVGGLLLPVLVPSIGGTLAACCACGSYVGMSSSARLHDELFALLAGALAGFCYFWGITVIAGVGGRLGTTAFGSALAISFLAQEIILPRQRHPI